MLEDDEWKYDVMPEIMDGKNVADFVDSDIHERLAALEAEEEKLIAEGYYDTDPEFDVCVVLCLYFFRMSNHEHREQLPLSKSLSVSVPNLVSVANVNVAYLVVKLLQQLHLLLSREPRPWLAPDPPVNAIAARWDSKRVKRMSLLVSRNSVRGLAICWPRLVKVIGAYKPKCQSTYLVVNGDSKQAIVSHLSRKHFLTRAATYIRYLCCAIYYLQHNSYPKPTYWEPSVSDHSLQMAQLYDAECQEYWQTPSGDIFPHRLYPHRCIPHRQRVRL